VNDALDRLLPRSRPKPVVVRQYGRDSLLVWANILLAPLMTALGLRVGLRSDEQIAERMAEDAAAMRRKGYLVASTETFALPVPGSRDAGARWYRVTYELSAPVPSESPE
jgi:hypothetical protein